MEITKLRLKVNLAYCSTLMYIISTDTNVQNGTVTMRLVWSVTRLTNQSSPGKNTDQSDERVDIHNLQGEDWLCQEETVWSVWSDVCLMIANPVRFPFWCGLLVALLRELQFWLLMKADKFFDLLGWMLIRLSHSVYYTFRHQAAKTVCIWHFMSAICLRPGVNESTNNTRPLRSLCIPELCVSLNYRLLEKTLS